MKLDYRYIKNSSFDYLQTIQVDKVFHCLGGGGKSLYDPSSFFLSLFSFLFWEDVEWSTTGKDKI